MNEDTNFPPFEEAIFENYFQSYPDLSAMDGPDDNTRSPLVPFEILRVRDSTLIEEPIPIFMIGDAVIGTRQNIVAFAAQPKKGKTAVMSMVIAGGIAPGACDIPPQMFVEPANGAAVIHIETEQSRSRHQKNHRTILRRAVLAHTPDNFISLNLRALPLDEYEKVTLAVCEAAKKQFGSVHSIHIDGAADYIPDTNDPVASNALVKFCETLAINFNCLVIVILHLNPGSDKERGHLGSQVQRKVESLLTIDLEDGVSTIKPKFLRNAGNDDVPLIQFAYDRDKGYHAYTGVKAPENKAVQNKDDLRLDEVKKVCRIIFGGQKALLYGEACDEITRVTHKGITACKNMFSEMKAHLMIDQGEDQRWRLKVV